jgi:hypothetical protein
LSLVRRPRLCSIALRRPSCWLFSEYFGKKPSTRAWYPGRMSCVHHQKYPAAPSAHVLARVRRRYRAMSRGVAWSSDAPVSCIRTGLPSASAQAVMKFTL